MLKRRDDREYNQIRDCSIDRNYLQSAHGSVLIAMGNTKVLCTATLENNVPKFIKHTNQGWLTAEYGMLPCATATRNDREAIKGKQKGRSIEIQRLIGRSLRQMINFVELGEKTIKIDCDVIQADGGTRTAAITGGAIAIIDAIKSQIPGKFDKIITTQIAAISVGICDNTTLLDLDYSEDSTAQTDMNIVLNNQLDIIEIQGTAEQKAFGRSQLTEMLDLAEGGIQQLLSICKK